MDSAPLLHRDRITSSYATPSAVQHSPPHEPGPAGTNQSNICSGLAETEHKASQLRPWEPWLAPYQFFHQMNPGVGELLWPNSSAMYWLTGKGQWKNSASFHNNPCWLSFKKMERKKIFFRRHFKCIYFNILHKVSYHNYLITQETLGWADCFI